MTHLSHLRGLGLAFFYALAPVAQADTGLFAQWHTDTYSEPEPIATTLKNWGDEFGAGEHQWLLSEFTLGYRFQRGFELSWQKRGHAATRINSEAAAFYGRIQREASLPESQSVPLRLSADSFVASSLRLGYSGQWQSLTYRAGLSYLAADHLTDGTLWGAFQSEANNDYQVAAQIDYVYYTDPVFNRPDIERARGQGIAADFSLNWQITPEWEWALQANDLFAAIDWEDAPHTIGQANTRRKRVDEEGYASFDPLFSGRERYKDRHRQRIAPRVEALVRHHWHQWSINAQWRRQFDVNHWGAGAGYRFANGQQITLAAWPERRAVELQWRTRQWQVALNTDLKSWHNTQSLGLTLTYNPGI